MEIKIISSLYPTPFDTRRQPKLVRGDIHHRPLQIRDVQLQNIMARMRMRKVCAPVQYYSYNIGRGLWPKAGNSRSKMNSLEEKLKVIEGYCELVSASEQEKCPEIERLKKQMDTFEEDRGTPRSSTGTSLHDSI